MNRRSFLTSAATVPLALPLRSREVRAGLLVDGSTPVHMIVTSHLSPAAAERHRRSWIGKVFETWGEWYVVGSEARDLPNHLAAMPGTMTHHDTLYGEAAEEQEYLVGAFRREHVSCIVRMREDSEPLMLRIAEHIAGCPLPDLFATAWSDVQLQAFIPNEEDLGLTVEDGTTFWP